MDDLAYFPPGTETQVGCLSSGLRVRWYERKPASGGGPVPTVLCLHGFPELAVSWREQLAGLGDQFRVVAPDMRGYGGTDAPSRIRDYRLELLVRDVVELIDLLGEDKVHLVGHDWGGAIAWEVAQYHGDRLRSLCVLNCPPHRVMVEGFKRFEQLRRSWYIFLFQLPFLPEWILTRDPESSVRKMFLSAAHNREPFTDRVLEPYIRQLRERGLPGLNYYRAQGLGLPHELIPIDVPTRLIWGLRDHALGSWFAEAGHYDFVRDFDRVLIEDSGHWPAQEAAPQVEAALREHFERAD